MSIEQAVVLAFLVGAAVAAVAIRWSSVGRVGGLGALRWGTGGPSGSPSQPTFISPTVTSPPGTVLPGGVVPLIEAMMKDASAAGVYRRCGACGATEADPAATACSSCQAPLVPLPGISGMTGVPAGVKVIQSSVRVQWQGGQIPPDLTELVTEGLQPCPGCGGHDWQGQLGPDGRGQLVCSHCGRQHP